MQKLLALLPGRWTLIASIFVAILLPLAIWTSYGWGVAHNDRVRETARANALDTEINDQETGLKVRVARCEFDLKGKNADLEKQTQMVSNWKVEADRARARGQAAVDAARARNRALELELLSPRPSARLEGETACEAADRMLLEELG